MLTALIPPTTPPTKAMFTASESSRTVVAWNEDMSFSDVADEMVVDNSVSVVSGSKKWRGQESNIRKIV